MAFVSKITPPAPREEPRKRPCGCGKKKRVLREPVKREPQAEPIPESGNG